MGFFSKFRKNKEENIPPEVTVQEQAPESYQETIPEYEPPEKEEKSKEKKKEVKVKKKIVKEEVKTVSTGNIPEALKADIERLKVQVEELSEIRKFNAERVSGLNERIGELRSMIAENEKRMKDIQVMATMASDLVKEVQPEALGTEVKKVDAKIEAVKARTESNETLQSSIIEELKDIRNKAMVYKGTEQVLKLNEEVKEQLLNIQKLKALTERHSDKVESIFVDVNKNFAEFKRVGQNVDNISKGLADLQKDVTTLNVSVKNMADKRDVNSKLLEFDKELINLKKLHDVTDKLTELVADNKKGVLDLENYRDKINKNLDVLGNYLKKLTKIIKNRSSDKQVEDLNEKIAISNKRITGLLDLVKTISKTDEAKDIIDELEEKKSLSGVPEELQDVRLILKKAMKNADEAAGMLEKARKKGDKYEMNKAKEILEQENNRVKQALKNVVYVKKRL